MRKVTVAGSSVRIRTDAAKGAEGLAFAVIASSYRTGDVLSPQAATESSVDSERTERARRFMRFPGHRS
jgi:hypothetical protein